MAILPRHQAIIAITGRCRRLLPPTGDTTIITMLRPTRRSTTIITMLRPTHRATTIITKLRLHHRSTTIITTVPHHRRSITIITMLRHHRRSTTIVTMLQRHPRSTSTPRSCTLRVIPSPICIFILFSPGKCLIKSFYGRSNLTFPSKTLMVALMVLKSSLPSVVGAKGCSGISIMRGQ
ncbi:hypothetical protein VPH35_029996 [Triticum aestivum]